jgi:purine nucleosidase
MPGDEPLYAVAIGAITNIASAIALEPKIIEKIVVLWLGGHALHWPHTREFNLNQDKPAARVIFDSGVPVVLFPCRGVVDRLATTNQELAACLYGRSRLGDYLVDIVRAYNKTGRPIWSKVIWDVALTAWLIKPQEMGSTALVHSPLLSDAGTWSHDPHRHLIRVATDLPRDRIFTDVFDRIAAL